MSDAPTAAEFESLLTRLRATVQRLETDELTLQQAVEAYEEAVALATACQRLLDEAELRISQIDTSAREVRERAPQHDVQSSYAARLLLGEDDDLADLLDDELP